jgi:nicotinamide-nucleotide amidase
LQAIAEEVVRAFQRLGLTLSVAESCTGGMIGHLITDVPGSSRVFPGGVIAYGNQPKRSLLQVPAELLNEHGAVSAEVAAAMAEGARLALGTEIAVAETGIAGPTGGNAEKPIGTVFIACASPSGTFVERHTWTEEPEDGGSEASVSFREQYKRNTALAALALALRAVEG